MAGVPKDQAWSCSKIGVSERDLQNQEESSKAELEQKRL